MGRIFKKLLGLLFVAAVLMLLTFGYFRHRMEPTLQKLAQEKLKTAASFQITEAVSREIQQGGLRYDQIICFEKDGNGRITALKTDMQQVNRLKSRILSGINSQILSLDASQIGVPLGSLLLPELFSGRGPVIPVRILSIRRSGAELLSDFSQAGINQTLHKIRMQVQVEGSFLVLGRLHSFSVSGQVLVAETVIVGEVPHTFS